MSRFQEEILYKVLNAIDSDDIEAIASFAETNLSKEELGQLQKMLKERLIKEANSGLIPLSARQFINFLY